MGSAIAEGIEHYVKREGERIFVRPTRWAYNSARADAWVNGMDSGEARVMAAELIRLADEAEKPEYKPGRVYVSRYGNRYVRTNDGRFVAFGNNGAGWAGDILDDDNFSHPLTEEGS